MGAGANRFRGGVEYLGVLAESSGVCTASTRSISGFNTLDTEYRKYFACLYWGASIYSQYFCVQYFVYSMPASPVAW